MREVAYQMLDENIRHTFRQSPSPMPEIKVDMEFKQNFYLLYKEALNNANKYSEASNIEIEVSFEEPLLSLRIEDNGKGFDVQNIKEGSGLGNMKSRAHEINGTYTLQSEPGKGTQITLSAPVTGYPLELGS